MAELKPCPFCGGDNIQFLVEGYFQPWANKGMLLWYRCACYDCGCAVDTGDCTDMDKATKNGTGGQKMANEKLISVISTIERALGMIEGISYVLCDSQASAVMDAVEKIDGALEVLKDGT